MAQAKRKARPKTNLGFYAGDELMRPLDEIARVEDRSKSSIVRLALAEYIARWKAARAA